MSGDAVLGRPGPGDVVVDVAVTVTSTGTELARFRSLPNAAVKYPHRPGFMAAGKVIADSSPFEAGDEVAVRHVPHQSGVVAPRANVHAIPPGVDLMDAALWHLGLVALYGLRRGDYAPSEPLAVVGAGIVGALARRLGAAMGTPECLVVATSDAKRWTLDKETTAHWLALSDAPLDDELERYPLTVDATGTAEGLQNAVALTAAGGRVVLLGSPRAETSRFPCVRSRSGESASSEPHRHAQAVRLRTFCRPRGRAHRQVLSTARGRSLILGSNRASQPGRPAAVYEVAAQQPSFVAAAFDWSGERLEPYFDLLERVPVADAPPLRFALIGCGDIGARNALALQEAEGVRLTTIFDPIADLAGQLAKKHRAKAVESLAEAITDSDVDAVLIATPHDTHEGIVRASLAAGKHVLLEKPLAADLDSAVRISRMAEASELAVAVLFFLRSDRRFVRAVRAIESAPDCRPRGATSTYLSRKPGTISALATGGRRPPGANRRSGPVEASSS